MLRDPAVFNQLDQSKVRRTGIYNQTNSVVSKNGKKMDKISLNINLFLQIKDKGVDLTIIPFEVTLDFMGKWKRGIGSKHGHTQDLKSELIDVSVSMKECQGAINFENGKGTGDDS